jgi:nucleoside-diphosphate-sugar epimerase
MQHALIVGASGITGGYILKELSGRADWRVTGLARSPPADPGGNVRFLPVDLLDKAASARALAPLRDVSHIFYCGFVPLGPADKGLPPNGNIGPNLALLTNTVEAIEAVSPALAHVSVMQGTKYYGSHLGPFKTPAKEDDPRHPGANFYFDQQDFAAAHSRGKAWSWSAIRPHTVCGFRPGNPMNLLSIIAVYAAIMKALGRPLTFPGREKHFRSVYQVTDAGLLARATIWAATTPTCAGHAFNITNGDFFRWENLWPRIAALFGMAAGGVETIGLEAFMADKGPLWQSLIERHGLLPIPLEKSVNWAFGDYVFRAEWDQMSDTGKARRLGFAELIDSEARLLEQLAELRAMKYVP